MPEQDVAPLLVELEAIGDDPETFQAFVNAHAPHGKVRTIKRNDSGKMTDAVVKSVPELRNRAD